MRLKKKCLNTILTAFEKRLKKALRATDRPTLTEKTLFDRIKETLDSSILELDVYKSRTRYSAPNVVNPFQS